MATSFFGGAFFGGEFFNTPPSPPVITTPNLSGSIGSAPFGRTFIQQVKSPKKEPYKFRRSMENQDRTDIEAIMQILAKGGFL
jgi:hypothetical protein